MARIRIGVSGWRYTPWRGVFYPEGLPQHAELAFAARAFSALEINGSFYSLQRPEYYAQWYAETPDDFVFALKGSRFITHMKRLRDIEVPLANFFASGVFNLREKLGPVLWQFPPNFRYDAERMRQFFDLLPHDTERALALARRRDARLKGRARLAIDEPRALRHAVEIRHASFLDSSFVDLLRSRGIALVVAETARLWPMTYDVTSDFMYLRLHGDRQIYQSGYGDKALERWAERIRAWHAGSEPSDASRVSGSPPPTRGARDVYCFFDNTDVKLRAPVDARSLSLKLGVAPSGKSAGPRAKRDRIAERLRRRDRVLPAPPRHASH
jgi:uncharacterized protein YecE (DUF72 family)